MYNNSGTSFMLERDVEVMSRVLREVEDWQGLAAYLNVRASEIVEDCSLRDGVPSHCFRRRIVRRYCDSLYYDDPEWIAEGLATQLEEMDHNRLANVMRTLQFGELRVLGHGYCAALKECADLGFVVN